MAESEDDSPWGKNKRRHTRVELYATVALMVPDETLILTVRNISLGGAFLLSDGHDLSALALGSEQEVVLVDGQDPETEVVVKAVLVRKATDGVALKWDGEEAIFKVAAVLDGATSWVAGG